MQCMALLWVTVHPTMEEWGISVQPSIRGSPSRLKQPFICAEGLKMTMQPLLIAPDGAINKAMIHAGPVLTSFFTPQSLKPQGPSYLTPPLCSSSSSSSQSVVPRLLPDVFILTALIFQMPKNYTIPSTAAHSWVNGLWPGYNMLHSGIPGRKIGFTLLLPFAPFVFLHPSHFFFFFFLPPRHLAAFSICLLVR